MNSMMKRFLVVLCFLSAGMCIDAAPLRSGKRAVHSSSFRRYAEYERLSMMLEEQSPALQAPFMEHANKVLLGTSLKAADKKALQSFLKTVAADADVNPANKKAITQFFKRGLSTGAKIGIGVGSAAVLAAIAAIAVQQHKRGKGAVGSRTEAGSGSDVGPAGAGTEMSASVDVSRALTVVGGSHADTSHVSRVANSDSLTGSHVGVLPGAGADLGAGVRSSSQPSQSGALVVEKMRRRSVHGNEITDVRASSSAAALTVANTDSSVQAGAGTGMVDHGMAGAGAGVVAGAEAGAGADSSGQAGAGTGAGVGSGAGAGMEGALTTCASSEPNLIDALRFIVQKSSQSPEYELFKDLLLLTWGYGVPKKSSLVEWFELLEAVKKSSDIEESDHLWMVCHPGRSIYVKKASGETFSALFSSVKTVILLKQDLTKQKIRHPDRTISKSDFNKNLDFLTNNFAATMPLIDFLTQLHELRFPPEISHPSGASFSLLELWTNPVPLGVGVSEICGKRRTMEDAVAIDFNSPLKMAGVFDGHGGYTIAAEAASKLFGYLKHLSSLQDDQIKLAFIKFDEDLRLTREDSGAGSTAIIALFLPDGGIKLVNLGDSRAVVFDNEGKVLEYTRDHDPSNAQELSRITACGGEVIRGRIDGDINVSRAFGDFRYKKAGGNTEDIGGKRVPLYKVSNCPDVITLTVEQLRAARYVVLACDGLWDAELKDTTVLINEYVGSLIKRRVEDSSLSDFARSIALNGWSSGDNVSVVIIDLHTINKHTTGLSDTTPSLVQVGSSGPAGAGTGAKNAAMGSGTSALQIDAEPSVLTDSGMIPGPVDVGASGAGVGTGADAGPAGAGGPSGASTAGGAVTPP